MENGIYTEVPSSLKRLVRMVMRGFYTIEHVILIDMLIRNPCMKEDDLVDLLQFERKQLRATISQLKNDRFVKIRLRMETGPDGKATRQNYYYINYKVFVNVVKYKLDHMRRKIEMEERDSTSRASFKCTCCEKTFTDLEAGQLFDMESGDFRCSYCSSLVEEDSSALPRTDSRLLLAKFNDQIESLYVLLREVEDIRLAPEILEPEPTDISHIKRDTERNKPTQNRAPGEHQTWSGDATRNRNFMLGNEQGITINFGDSATIQDAGNVEKKERPIWMSESTVINNQQMEGQTDSIDPLVQAAQNAAQPRHSQHIAPPPLPTSTPGRPLQSQGHHQENIMEVLLAHESQTTDSQQTLVIPGVKSESKGQENEDGNYEDVAEMESDDDEDEVATVQIGSERIALHDVTPQHIENMTPAEKEIYIKLGQEMYSYMNE